jgi:hypothetical protein
MTTREFLLDPDRNRRLEVCWTDQTPASVSLDGRQLFVFADAREQETGKDTLLADGSLLQVRFVGGEPQVLKGGVIQVPTGGERAPALPRRRGGCLTAWFIINLVAILFLTVFYLLAAFGTGVAAMTSDVPTWVFLAYGLVGCLGVAGLVALLAWRRWGFFAVVAYALLNTGLDLVLRVASLQTVVPLVGVVILYRLLRWQGVWEELT